MAKQKPRTARASNKSVHNIKRVNSNGFVKGGCYEQDPDVVTRAGRVRNQGLET